MCVYCVYLYCFQNQSPSLRFPQFTLSNCIVFRTSLPASDSLSLHCVFVLFSEPVSQPQIPSVYTVYLFCFQNQSPSLSSLSLHCLFVLFSEPVSQPQIPSDYTVYLFCFQNQSPSLNSLSLHCLFVLFSEPVTQHQIPSVYTVYLYCFQNQSPSLRFPQFTLSICIVFRTSLPASDSLFTLSICIVSRTSLPASDSLSLHCLFVLFSEPVSQPQILSVYAVYLYFQNQSLSQPQIPSVYTVYLYCFQTSLPASDSLRLHCIFVLFSDKSPSFRFPQFTLSICIVFRTSLPASDSLSLHCLFVLFSEPVAQPQIPSVYTVYLYCFQNQSPSLRFPQFTLSICIVFRTSLPASDSLSLHCLFVLFSEPVSQPQILSVYAVYLYFQNQSLFQPQIPSVYTVYLYCFQTSLPASDSLRLHCIFVLFSDKSPSFRFPQFTLSICIVFRTSLPASDSLSLHCLFVLFSEPVAQPQIPSVYTVYLYCFQNQSPSLRFPQFTLSICIVFRTSLPASDSLSLHCLFVLFSEPVSQPQIPSVNKDIRGLEHRDVSTLFYVCPAEPSFETVGIQT